MASLLNELCDPEQDKGEFLVGPSYSTTPTASVTPPPPSEVSILQSIDTDSNSTFTSRVSIEAPTVREGVALYNLPTCYRQVHRRMELCEPLFMAVKVFEFEAKSSFRKCPTRTKNQERIFIPGDIVSVLMNFDPFVHTGDIWFVVKKRKSGALKLWKRSWSVLKEYLQSVPRIATMRLRVVEVGYVYEDKRAHPQGYSGTLPLECAAVVFGTQNDVANKKNILWLEVGLFDIENVKGESVYINDYVSPKVAETNSLSGSSSSLLFP